MSAARAVTTALRRELYPRLVELGFEPKGRTATRVDGPVTSVFVVSSFNTRMAQQLRVPTSSFQASLGVDYSGARPASFASHIEPWMPDIAQTQLQAHLSVTDADRAGPGRPDVWVVDDVEAAPAAVRDLAAAFEQQAVPLLLEWSDLDLAHDYLSTAEGYSLPGGVGGPGLLLPGELGSIARLSELAVLAAHRGAVNEEIRHLTALQELSPDPLYENRIRELGR